MNMKINTGMNMDMDIEMGVNTDTDGAEINMDVI